MTFGISSLDLGDNFSHITVGLERYLVCVNVACVFLTDLNNQAEQGK